MTSHVIDASALLAYLQDEPGAPVVAAALQDGAACSTVNWSEVAQKIRVSGASWQLAAGLLDSFDVVVTPLSRGDAEAAADRWEPGSGLSLADRCCLALAQRIGVPALTADAAWGERDGIIQIR